MAFTGDRVAAAIAGKLTLSHFDPIAPVNRPVTTESDQSNDGFTAPMARV